MNVSVLHTLEKGWVSLDWKEYLKRKDLASLNLSELVDVLDNWKSNRACKEIVLFKYKTIPAYITIKRTDFKLLAKWLMNELAILEMYEDCSHLKSIWNKL